MKTIDTIHGEPVLEIKNDDFPKDNPRKLAVYVDFDDEFYPVIHSCNLEHHTLIPKEVDEEMKKKLVKSIINYYAYDKVYDELKKRDLIK